MNEERVRIRKIYPAKAALTGLGFGFFLGLIFAIILIILSFFDVGQFEFQERTLDFLSPGFVAVISVLIIILFSLFFALIALLWALFYNLISKIGINVDLGLIELEEENSEKFHLDERLKSSFY